MLNDLLRRAASLHRDREAIRLDDEFRTFGQAYERACRLANALADAGVKPGDRVATLAKNRLESLEEMYAIALGGFVRSPLYSFDAPQRQASMLEKVEAAALIVDETEWRTLSPVLKSRGSVPGVVFVHDVTEPEDGVGYEAALANASDDDPMVTIDPDAIHVVRFSSGTTGTPKAIAHTERGYHLVGVELMLNFPPLDESTTYLAISPFSHGSGNMVWPLTACGGRQVLMKAFEPGDALRLIEEQSCTLLFVVPTIVRALCADPAANTADLSSVNCILYGASPFPQSLVRRALDVFGPVLVQCYGQSELPGVTFLRQGDHARFLEAGDRRLASAGRASANTFVRIVRPDGSPAEPGETGEIAAKSETMMAGFWHDDAATAARLTKDGWLRTGDVGYMDRDGYLFVTDRVDDLIISGGFNISPAEIEDALMDHPSVVEAVVFGVPDEKWGQTPMAVIRSLEGSAINGDALVEWTRQKVGATKKAAFVLVTNEPLPTNGAGKVLRRVAREKWLSSFPGASTESEST